MTEAGRLRAQKTANIVWAAIGVILLAAGALWVLAQLSAVLAPFGMAGVVLLLLRTPVDKLEARGMKRGLAVGVCYVGVFAALGLATAFLVPVLISRFVGFANDFPGYYEAVLTFWKGIVAVDGPIPG